MSNAYERKARQKKADKMKTAIIMMSLNWDTDIFSDEFVEHLGDMPTDWWAKLGKATGSRPPSTQTIALVQEGLREAGRYRK